jgi:hypothetical protein
MTIEQALEKADGILTFVYEDKSIRGGWRVRNRARFLEKMQNWFDSPRGKRKVRAYRHRVADERDIAEIRDLQSRINTLAERLAAR